MKRPSTTRRSNPYWKKGPRIIKREWPHDEKGQIIGVVCVKKDGVWVHE